MKFWDQIAAGLVMCWLLIGIPFALCVGIVWIRWFVQAVYRSERNEKAIRKLESRIGQLEKKSRLKQDKSGSLRDDKIGGPCDE